MFWLFNQYGSHYHIHYISKGSNTHIKLLVCLVTTLSFSMPFAPPPVPTSPDTLCCVWMAWKCAVYIWGKRANCTVLTYAMGTQLFMAEGHNYYHGLVHGLHVGKNNRICNTCLTIVKFWKYTHNLQCGCGPQIQHGGLHVGDPWVMSILSLTQL